MNVREIKERLNVRAAEVCELLLPAGKMENGKWICGDARGTPGTSLKVNLTGPYVGTYCDFGVDGPDKGGDLIKLWQVAKGVEFGRAIEEVKAFLGIRDEGTDVWQPGTHKGGGRGQVPKDWGPVKEGGGFGSG
jgi:hypothetical protein